MWRARASLPCLRYVGGICVYTNTVGVCTQSYIYIYIYIYVLPSFPSFTSFPSSFQINYRSHASILKVSSSLFYHDRLRRYEEGRKEILVVGVTYFLVSFFLSFFSSFLPSCIPSCIPFFLSSFYSSFLH